MKALITGGTGAVGKATVEMLTEAGWEARVVGRRPDMDVPNAEYAVCNVTDIEEVRKQVRGCDAVVHLAAIPSPIGAPGHQVFGDNTSGTYNVFQAAAEEGIGRVVQASSINSFGCFFSLVDRRIDYLPINEDHPTRTTDPYSFSKNVIEAVGDYFWRRDGISSVALRLPAVWRRQVVENPKRQQGVRDARAFLEEFAALDEDERRDKLARAKQSAIEFRARRPFEWETRQRAKEAGEEVRLEDDGLGPLLHMYTYSRFDLWTAVDEYDSAQSIVKGLTADYEGAHVLFINDKVNWLGYDSNRLADWFFPDAEKRSLKGCDSLVSIDKARRLIGYEPEHSIIGWLADS